MQIIEKKPFTYDHKQFLLKLFSNTDSYTVIAFLGTEQVSPSYSISFEANHDYFTQYKTEFIEHLFDIARSDIENKLYFHV